MAMSESAPRAAVALKELARKNEASSGTLRIMGLLLSSVSTCAPGRLDLRGRRERPDLRKVDIPPHRHYERWDATGLLLLVKPTSAGPSRGRSSCPRGPTRAKPVCSGLAAGRKGASTGCATRSGCCRAASVPEGGRVRDAGVAAQRRSQLPFTRRRPMKMEKLMSLLVGTMLVFAAASAAAQTPAPAAPPPPPPYGLPITLEQAKKVMVGAEAEAKKNNWNVVIAVLDSGGNVVMLQRMDGAQFGSIEVAREKAYSAVAFRRPTKLFQDLIEQGGVNMRLLRVSGLSPLEGGLPIIVDGKLVGGVGVSGVTSQQDAQIGRAGVEGLK